MGFLTRIFAQGAWVDLNGGVDGVITNMTEYNGKLVVVGNFMHAGGLYSPHMAFWDGTNWQAAGLDSLSAIPQNLVVNNDTLFSCYYFQLHYWNGTGWNTYLQLPSETDRAISYHNEIYFTSYSGMLLYRITNDTILMIGQMSGGISDMTIYHDQLFATGCFDYINGSRYGHIASYDGTAWHLVANGFTSGSYGTSLEIINGLLYIGGTISPFGSSINYNLLTYDDSNLQVESVQPGYQIIDMKSVSDNLFINSVNDSSYNVKLLDSTSWRTIGEIKIISTSYLYPTMMNFNNKLYVAGEFSTINGATYNNVARWEESNGINPNNLTENEKLTIYPNPTHDFITICIPSNKSQINTELSITDINGNQISKQNIIQNNLTLSVENLPAGLYIVKVSNEKEVFVGKLIKQ